MNKKILIGSLVAVFILIMVTFTSVVGYRSIESNVKDSPLFNIRSSRAINEESKDIACNYVGKGEVTNICLPKGNDRTDSVDALINVVKRMDDKSLQRFAYLITYRLKQSDELQQYDSEDIFQSLKQLRDNPEEIQLHLIQDKESNINSRTINFECETLDYQGILECLKFWLFILLILPVVIWELFLSLFTLGVWLNC